MRGEERFEIIREIGRGAQGVTFLAWDRALAQEVAFKQLRLHDSVSWDVVQLFERESRALQSLEHAGIPKYIDAFHSGESGASFVLVQEYVAGENLADLIAQGFRMDAAQTRSFIEAMLKILTYLHELNPPVIHRDIKPSNIIRRPDGGWVLIDFGGVQSSGSGEDVVGGALQPVVGTTGYMPFEQILGRAVAASDLYALGATVVHVLSHQHPSDLPVDDSAYMKLLFKPFITTTSEIEVLLEGLLEPLVEQRIQTARQALAMLQDPALLRGKTSGGGEMSGRLIAQATPGQEMFPIDGAKRIRGGKVSFRLARRGTALGARSGMFRVLLWMVGVVFVLNAIARGFREGALFDAFLWGQGVVALVYLGRLPRPVLQVTEDALFLGLPWFGWWKRRIARGDVVDVDVVPYRTLLGRVRGYRVRIGVRGGRAFYFGSGQTQEEGEWLAFEIRSAVLSDDSCVAVRSTT